MVRINFMKIDEQAVIPSYAHYGDACMDLHVLVDENNPIQCDGLSYKFNESVDIFPHQTFIFHTGLKCSTEKGYAMRIYPRSSTGIKRGLMLANTTAVIDTATYRGEIMLAFTNHSNNMVTVNHLDKLAQCEIYKVEPVEVHEVYELDETERGENGIGSTGT